MKPVNILKNFKQFYKLLNSLQIAEYDSEIISEYINQYITSDNINQKNKQGETLLLWVIGNFTGLFLLKIVTLFLQAGASPNLKGTLYLRTEFSNNYNYRSKKNTHIIYQNISPLLAMTKHYGNDNNYQIIESLFEYGAYINFDFNEYINSIKFHNYYDFNILKLFVINGLDIKNPNLICMKFRNTNDYMTPIMMLNYYNPLFNCSYQLKFDIFKYMIDNNCDLSYTTRNLSFWNMFESYDYLVKNELIKYLNSKNKNTKKLFISKECIICYNTEKQLCLTKCGHAISCQDCFIKLKQPICPYCNQYLQDNNYQLIKFIS